MHEDYVSFELAKKLKEKGFLEECFYFYSSKSKKLMPNSILADDINCVITSNDFCIYHSNGYPNMIDAPTITQVLRWLREEKNLHIVIPATFNKNYWWEILDFNRDISEYSDAEYSSYQESVLAGIEYILDKLL